MKLLLQMRLLLMLLRQYHLVKLQLLRLLLAAAEATPDTDAPLAAALEAADAALLLPM